MSTNTSYRLSGVALVLGSAISVVYYVIQGWFLSGTSIAAILSPLDFASQHLAIIGGVLVLLGLPGLYARQAERAGILGLLGFVLIWYVTLMQSVLIPLGNLSFMSDMTAHIIPQSVATLMTPPPAWAAYSVVSMIGQVVGLLSLGIATVRAKVFPRWTGWTLLACLALGVVSMTPFVPEALSNLVAVVASIAIIGIGVTLLTPARDASEAVKTSDARAFANA